MADEITREIFKIELDDAGYARGVDSMTASTNKLVQAQDEANKRLQTNQQALKVTSEFVIRTKNDLDAYTGTNKRYREQLEKDFAGAQADQKKLIELVKQNQIAYDNATKAAQSFVDTAAKASELQIQVGGKFAASPLAVPQQTSEIVQQIKVQVDKTQLSELPEIIIETEQQFEDLRGAVLLLEETLKQLDPKSEEFRTLAAFVDNAKKAVQKYDEIAQQTTGHQISLRQEILNGNNELARLEQAGKAATQQYIELEKRVAHLSELYREQRERIRVLSSETRALDFGRAAIESAISGFEIYTSISILAGNANEELQKKTLQLFAAMQLLTSLERIAEQVKRGGIISTNLQAVAQSVYTAAVGASTGALRAFRIALLGTGIGAAAIAIGFLIKKYIDHKEAVKKAAEEQKVFRDVTKEAAKSAAEAVVKLEQVRRTLTDTNTPQKERLAVLKEYNKTADKTNEIDATQINNLTLINEKIAAQNTLIIQRAQSTAALDILTAQENKVLESQLNLDEALNQAGLTEQQLVDIENKTNQERAKALNETRLSLDNYGKQVIQSGKIQKQTSENVKTYSSQEIQALKALLLARDQTRREAEELAAKLNKFIVTPPPPKKEEDKKKIENDFLQRKAELDRQLAELMRKEADDELKIRAQFAAELRKQLLDIDKALKEKRITAPQAQILRTETVQINTLQVEATIKELNKKITDARQKLNDQLRTLQQQANQDELNLIEDEFKKRAALIDFNEQKELENQKAATDERLKALDLERLLIGEEEYQKARQIIVSTGEREVNSIVAKAAGERKDLSADIFKKSLEAYQKAILAGDLVRNEQLAEQIRKQSDRFLQGKISFERYQREITAIQKKAEAQRRDGEIQVLVDELNDLDRHLAAIKDINSKEYKDTIETQKKLRAELAGLRQADAQADAKDVQEKTDERTKAVQAYTSAIGELATSVISFWQAANAAEQKALERSITIQEERVSAAQRIADRGNAQYLKAETDRLKELQVARENAARKQLGIDAALQASQLLVGITGAIAKIASGIGAAETIAEIAVIVAALATGYGLVKSLQGNQPRLREGTPEIRRGSHPAGVDTIPAWLDEGEAVLPKEKNKKYKKSVEAIYHGKVPAEVLNTFVENYVTNKNISTKENRKLSTYQRFIENVKKVPSKVLNETVSIKHLNEFIEAVHKIKPVPLLNYERIKDAAETHILYDSKSAVLLSEQNKMLAENNELQRTTIRALKAMGVNVNLDKNGFALSVMEVQEQLIRDKRV